ncbi:hypothetical protein IGB42_04223 [Andreprevotia sp. IGB-42]|uniref:PEP-CTERM sorting domain-containing protein n=1 Tax=Andreprevotia sp. IGB-42 TaxID=2497473 RepID=UPI00135A8CD1|nr:PEP-CTERM sorting domain-containing protein [Andreprevotia sp. IGB-42]KAF0811328.1 hypothetical protein IGB42_04223 [Andreprevotia sp. IGB-42]
MRIIQTLFALILTGTAALSHAWYNGDPTVFEHFNVVPTNGVAWVVGNTGLSFNHYDNQHTGSMHASLGSNANAIGSILGFEGVLRLDGSDTQQTFSQSFAEGSTRSTSYSFVVPVDRGHYSYAFRILATPGWTGGLNLANTYPLPEPETWALMGIGLTGALLARRRKKNTLVTQSSGGQAALAT